MTQINVAEAADISVNSLRLYEADKREPRFAILCDIADALDVNPFEILNDAARDMFFDGFNRAIETRRIALAETWEEYEKAEDDVFALLAGFDELDEDGQKRAITCLKALGLLNDEGQQKAVERVEELTEIPKYQRPDAPPAATEAPTEGE